MFYSVAQDMLLRQPKYRSKRGSFRSNQSGCSLHGVSMANQVFSKYVHSCLHVDKFLNCLLNFHIGTPLFQNGKIVDPSRFRWLKGIVQKYKGEQEILSRLKDFLGEIPVDGDGGDDGHYPELVLIESSSILKRDYPFEFRQFRRK